MYGMVPHVAAILTPHASTGKNFTSMSHIHVSHHIIVQLFLSCVYVRGAGKERHLIFTLLTSDVSASVVLTVFSFVFENSTVCQQTRCCVIYCLSHQLYCENFRAEICRLLPPGPEWNMCIFTHPCSINVTQYSLSQRAHIKPLMQCTPSPPPSK